MMMAKHSFQMGRKRKRTRRTKLRRSRASVNNELTARFARHKNLGFKRYYVPRGKGFGDRILHPQTKIGKFLKKSHLVSRAAAVLGNIPQLAFLKPASVAVGMLGYGLRRKRKGKAGCSCAQ